MSITIADVAARAGVSKTTVSRVLNGKGELDLRTAERVRQVIAELGYVPSARAVGTYPSALADPAGAGGDGFEIEIIGRRRPARLQPEPLFDPQGTRMRQ